MAASLTDRYLAARHSSRSQLLLVGLTAMFVASKYCEISGGLGGRSRSRVPGVADWVRVADRAYPQEELLRFEL